MQENNAPPTSAIAYGPVECFAARAPGTHGPFQVSLWGISGTLELAPALLVRGDVARVLEGMNQRGQLESLALMFKTAANLVTKQEGGLDE